MEKKETAKERILRVASRLFYKEGVRAVGIDRIIEESGVAKASFYRNFPTKDSLIVAYLEKRHCNRSISIEQAIQRFPDSPKDQLYALLDELVERMTHPEFRGCPFMNAVVEFPDLEHPGHRSAVENRHRTWDKVKEIAMKGGVRDPEELTSQLRIISDGAMMSAYIDKTSFRPEHFLSAAKRLIEHHFSG
ncbi:TetR/AcrR family transcriptional regulator [Paenibacillus sp. OAS669]|uniref:TetR/AcrR family transcriptional regulator n=1 Tax=Paenibacillus sp. OAS669 TaxID=2663821 RepID=UPI00178B0A82|nr:TetR/AcrR family transcriptional regulator [Paenibacillus sp. OAS669]MBE1442390.1 AcrR family transcriptional regulator [Paenibacillus sp. OAS669]